MSTRILILKDGVITPTKSSADTNAVINSLGIVDLVNNQIIGGIKTFSGGLVLPTTIGTSTGTVWRNVDNLEYKDSTNVTRITLNSAGNLSNLSNRQTALNNLVGTQTASRLLRSDGTNVTLSQINLSSDIVGILPIANGGANISTYVALTGGQTIAGSKVFVNPIVIRGNNPGFWFDETDFGKGLFVVLDGGVLQLQRLNNVGGYEANNLFVNLATGVVGISGGVSSTSTTTGTLQVGGGVGITGNVYAGGSVINFAGLPTSVTGLAAGSLWRNGTVVNIV